MLVAFSVTPIGAGESVGDLVAEAVRVVRASGLPNRTDAMFTTIEGEWDECFAVVKQAVEVARGSQAQAGRHRLLGRCIAGWRWRVLASRERKCACACDGQHADTPADNRERRDSHAPECGEGAAAVQVHSTDCSICRAMLSAIARGSGALRMGRPTTM